MRARSSYSPLLWLSTSANPALMPEASAICASASGMSASTSWCRRKTRLLSLMTRSCSLVACMRRSCASVSALALLSWVVLRISAVASRPASSATSRKAATCRHVVISIQFGGTWISATTAEGCSQP